MLKSISTFKKFLLFIISAIMLMLLNVTKVIYVFISLEMLNFLLLMVTTLEGNFYLVYIMMIIQVCEVLLMMVLLLMSFSIWYKYMNFSLL